jgi:hypothetical protein
MFGKTSKKSVRLMVGVPPKTFFGGNDRLNADVLIDSLRELYPNLFIFDIGVLFSNNRDRIETLIEAAKDFRPDLCIALPNAGYALMLKPPTNAPDGALKQTLWEKAQIWLDGHPPENIFTDILRVPTILLWDHIITQPAYLVLGSLPTSRSSGEFGAVKRLQHALSNPRFRHFVPDTGHIRVMSDLGIISGQRLLPHVVPAHTAFLAQGPIPTPTMKEAILFAGNLYASSRADFDPVDQSLVDTIADEIGVEKKKNWSAPGWDLLAAACAARVESFPELSPDNSFFWALANKLIAGHLSTDFRHEVLNASRLPIDYYGGFADREHAKSYRSGGQIVHRGSVPLSDLPQLYRSYQLSLDVTHCPFINGSNAKALDCFAAGGFMLVDRREDLAHEVGSVADAFMYRNKDEMLQRCDDVLTNDKFRREVIAEMRSIISERLTFNHLFQDLVEGTLSSRD